MARGERGSASLLAVCVLLVVSALAVSGYAYGCYGRQTARAHLHNVELRAYAQSAAWQAVALARDNPAALNRLLDEERRPFLEEQLPSGVRLVVNGKYLVDGQSWRLTCMAQRDGDHAWVMVYLSKDAANHINLDRWSFPRL